MARVALHVACRACGEVFDTGLRTDTVSFGRGTFAANYHTCPRCGTTETYRKSDYRLVDPRTGQALPLGRVPQEHGRKRPP
jgi:ribosomal protein L37E